jgi:hypothetical protein
MARKSAKHQPVETPTEQLKSHLPPFKKGQKVFVSGVGFGLTSYEPYTVDSVRKNGKVALQDLEHLFDGKTGKYLTPHVLTDFTVSLCTQPEQVTAALAYMKKYGGKSD